MPQTQFLLYADQGNVSPVLQWLDEQPAKVQEKILAGFELLGRLGHESRRPSWAPLRDGIYEMRVKHMGVNFRILCFFHGRRAIVAAHGCTKERTVDSADIRRAVRRMKLFAQNPAEHTYVDETTAPARKR